MCEQCFKTYQTSKYNLLHFWLGQVQYEFNLYEFSKELLFHSILTVTKCAGETCKTDMSLYLEGMVDVLVPTCTEIQIEC